MLPTIYMDKRMFVANEPCSSRAVLVFPFPFPFPFPQEVSGSRIPQIKEEMSVYL